MTSSTARASTGIGGNTLRGRIKSAALWTALAMFASQFIRFGSNLLITRFLAPEMFGIMAIVAMFQYLLFMITDVGLREGSIRSSEEEFERIYDTAWSLQIIRGFLISLAGLVIAGLLALAGWLQLLPPNSTYASPVLPLLLAANSLGAILLGFQSNKGWRLERQLDTRLVVMTDLLSQVISTALLCLLAWWTKSIWSMAISAVFAMGLSCLFSHLLLPGRNPRFKIDREIAGKLFKFGIWILFSSLCFVLSSNVDKMMFGWFLAPAVLGLFTIAQSLVSACEMVVIRIFSAIGTAAISEVARNDPEGLRGKFYSLRLPFDAVLCMSAGGLFACGSAIVHIIFDRRYAGVGPVLEILSFSLIGARYNCFSNLFVALGMTSNLLVMSVTRLVVGAIAIPLCYYTFGYNGAVVAVAFVGCAQLPVIIALCRGRNLVDYRFEALSLLAWLPGYGMGLVFARLFG